MVCILTVRHDNWGGVDMARELKCVEIFPGQSKYLLCYLGR